jgi:hypothetical protein
VPKKCSVVTKLEEIYKESLGILQKTQANTKEQPGLIARVTLEIYSVDYRQFRIVY